MYDKSFKSLVAFGIVEKVSVLSNNEGTWVMLVPNWGNKIQWPSVIELGYSKLFKQSAKAIPEELKPFIREDAIFYKAIVTVDSKDIPKYLLDTNIDLGREYFNYISEKIDDVTLAYETLVGILTSLAIIQTENIISPVWNIMNNIAKNSTTEKGEK